MSPDGTAYALIVGVAGYEHVRKLPEAVLNDARDLASVLLSPVHCGFPDSNLRLLLDEGATAKNLRSGLQWLAGAAGPEDMAFIFFSGHGARLEQGSQSTAYLVPYDADPSRLLETFLDGSELVRLFQAISAGRMLVLLDCCHASGAADFKNWMDSGLRYGLREKDYEALMQGKGRAIIASCRADEVSIISGGMRNSLFTHYLLNALRGDASRDGDGLIRIFQLFEYVAKHVRKDADQHPVFKATDLEDNFPVAFLRPRDPKDTIPAIHPVVNRTELRNAMVRDFSLEEFAELVAEVQQHRRNQGWDDPLNVEIVGGTTLGAKVLNLIGHLDRRGQLDILVACVRRQRPGTI
jgi:hypothetical protein